MVLGFSTDASHIGRKPLISQECDSQVLGLSTAAPKSRVTNAEEAPLGASSALYAQHQRVWGCVVRLHGPL
jgi:hypothetical protein